VHHPTAIIELLLNDCGVSACSKVAQPSGEAPLHFAVHGAILLATKSPAHHQGHQIIQLLLAVTCTSNDDWGGLSPLHIACQNHTSSKVIHMAAC
jgi:hypothetical protein